MENTEKCTACRGTGIRYDVTCAGNVTMDRYALAPCSWCENGVRPVPERKVWTPPAGDPAYEGVGDMPDWMLG